MEDRIRRNPSPNFASVCEPNGGKETAVQLGIPMEFVTGWNNVDDAQPEQPNVDVVFSPSANDAHLFLTKEAAEQWSRWLAQRDVNARERKCQFRVEPLFAIACERQSD